MVRAAVAGPHSSSYCWHAAQADSAGNGGAIHAVADAMAARRRWNSSRRRARHSGSLAPTAGVRDFRQCLGATDSDEAGGGLRSQVDGPTKPDRGGGMGKIVTASGYVGY